jgi:hypothetical protein
MKRVDWQDVQLVKQAVLVLLSFALVDWLMKDESVPTLHQLCWTPMWHDWNRQCDPRRTSHDEHTRQCEARVKIGTLSSLDVVFAR